VDAVQADLELADPPSDEQIENWIRLEEGTFNPETNRFLCDEDYIRAGMPATPDGWKCP
jgi:hypothetical protein